MGDLLPMRPASEQTESLEPLWREATGAVLRDRRHRRGETLSETAGRAGVSTQYLSEVERGRKDASSEVISAVAGALGLTLLDLTLGVARRLGHEPMRQPARPSVRPRGPLALAA
jgi:transcriptional regulator with XRE-family HTH domain